MKIFILIIISLVSLPFLWIGISELKNTIIEQKNGIKVQGQIVGNLRQAGAGGTVYNPQVKFNSIEGKTIVFTDPVGAYPADYAIGSRVKVQYQSSNPSQAIIYSFKRTYFIAILMIIIGLLPWVLCFFIFKKLNF
ncbi:MAG: DUF3592 domain-containing protein [Sphingobacteriaceae bacterium]